MITQNLGKIAITPKGQWVAGTYERLDLVTNAGSSYISLKDNNVSALNTADWMLVASKGDPFLYSDFTPEQLEALKVKGDPFLYSDFTPEQIAELQRPATDAAIAVNEAEALRVTAETTRVGNEQGRVTAEGTRQSNEIARENSEDDRDEAETLRLSAEITRGQNEQARITAEGLRVNAESTRQTNTATAINNANNAATLANTKAGLADTAAINANTKAGLADAAATTANTASTNISSTVINNEQVQAEIYNVLNARIAALEELIRNMIFATAIIDKVDVVNEFNIHGTTNLILKGTVAPAITPDFIGQFYINTTAGVTYQSKGITNSGDWKQTSN